MRGTDWQAIERDYRTGKFTLRELEAKHGPSNATISRRAKREGWTQDLTAAVRQATNAALITAMVADGCSAAQQDAAVAVLAAADLNKQVILGHRTELREARSVAMALLGELRASALLADEAELLTEIMAGEGAKPADVAQARAAVSKALAVSSRVGSVKALSEALTKLHAGERVAFGITSDGDGDDKPLSGVVLIPTKVPSHE